MYFGFAERHKGLLEDTLSRVLDRKVQIAQLQTSWIGLSPSIQINDLRVLSDLPGEDALSFKTATAQVSPWSLITFWPRFTNFVLEKPNLEVVTLADNTMQVAGITLKRGQAVGINRERLLSWLLNHSNVAWHEGIIRWRKSDNTTQLYTNISFIYEREQQTRRARGTITAPKGKVSASINVEGNPLSADDWDASVEVIKGTDTRFLRPGDLSFKVEDGVGKISLATLSLESIRDFLSLSGLAEKTRWILDSQLSGVLHDVEFGFVGALTKVSDWSITASATGVGFKSLDSLPALTNLNGKLNANRDQGSFDFTANNASFEWSKFYDKRFPVNEAKGRFAWQKNNDGGFQVSLENGQLTDPNLLINNINAMVNFDSQPNKVSTFADLFVVKSMNELRFENGEIVTHSNLNPPTPLSMNAEAQFEVVDISSLSGYLPKVKKITSFRKWLKKGFKVGSMSNGRFSYQGALSPNAIKTGEAQLQITSDYQSAVVDYAPEQSWPPMTQGFGSASLVNESLTVLPTEILLNGDKITSSKLTIDNIFSSDILLKVSGKTSTSLAKGMAFLFQGPLIEPKKQPKTLPVQPLAGNVDIDVSLVMPLNAVNDFEVIGTSRIRNGDVLLPEGIPLTGVNTVVNFTKDSITADKISAQFLGGQTQGKLITLEKMVPPKLQLQGNGTAHLKTLAPWTGEHLLTLFNGKADWAGKLDIDGSNLLVNVQSNLKGVTVSAPAPLSKQSDAETDFTVSMNLGGTRADGTQANQALNISYANLMTAEFNAKPMSATNENPSLFDQALIQLGDIRPSSANKPLLNDGIHIAVAHSALDLDDWLESIIELASFDPNVQSENTDFLDALRSVNIMTPEATSMSRPFGDLTLAISSPDGLDWSGTLSGKNVMGSMFMQPRADIGRYSFDLDTLIIGPTVPNNLPLDPIDKLLKPADYPALELTVDNLQMDGRTLGALDFYGRPNGQQWVFEKFALVHNGIRTNAEGQWLNTQEDGSKTSVVFNTTIEEAEGVLNDMDFTGYVRKGRGSMNGTLEWSGAPHDFDYSRLNGDFNLFLKDGELVQVEPGSGKLLGLLNFNAIARRLVFDFRDVFARGLQFDRIRYRGLLSNGEAVLQDSYILTPAVFVRMEGKLDLSKELIDMDVHISPELGGNLTLLSTLANPAAGAVVFLTSQLFKDEMRRASFLSYQAKGTWEDFELVEIDSEGKPLNIESNQESPKNLPQ